MRALKVCHSGHVLSVDEQFAGCRNVKDAKLVHHGRFTGARRSHDRHKFVLHDIERHMIERNKVATLEMVHFRDIGKPDEWDVTHVRSLIFSSALQQSISSSSRG